MVCVEFGQNSDRCPGDQKKFKIVLIFLLSPLKERQIFNSKRVEILKPRVKTILVKRFRKKSTALKVLFL